MKWNFVLAVLAGVLISPGAIAQAIAQNASSDVDAQIAHITQNVPAGVWGWMFGGEPWPSACSITMRAPSA